MKQDLTPRKVVEQWLQYFNKGDYTSLESLYAENALNHQMPTAPVHGKAAIGQMFKTEFEAAPEMHCIPVQIIEEGNWAVLEWRDPKDFRGCGFFEVKDGLIHTQRGYWDMMGFKRRYNLS